MSKIPKLVTDGIVRDIWEIPIEVIPHIVPEVWVKKVRYDELVKIIEEQEQEIAKLNSQPILSQEETDLAKAVNALVTVEANKAAKAASDFQREIDQKILEGQNAEIDRLLKMVKELRP